MKGLEHLPGDGRASSVSARPDIAVEMFILKP
jgi:hypothetical protein